MGERKKIVDRKELKYIYIIERQNSKDCKIRKLTKKLMENQSLRTLSSVFV